MKLRNKKTGEIWNIPRRRHPTCQEDDISFFAELTTNGKLFSYRSLAELNEEWEDYEPKEPLIKDEKVRKAVRTWANINGAPELKYDVEENSLEDVFRNIVSFNRVLDLKDGVEYTITELCGEEEE